MRRWASAALVRPAQSDDTRRQERNAQFDGEPLLEMYLGFAEQLLEKGLLAFEKNNASRTTKLNSAEKVMKSLPKTMAKLDSRLWTY